MPIDPVTNLAIVTVSTGYDASATEIILNAGGGASLPDPDADGNYNATWYNNTDYPGIVGDPNVEFVRIIGPAGTGNTKTITRAQEGTSASTKNIADKVYKLAIGLTKLTYDLIKATVATVDTYIDQSVVSGASPVFVGTNITAIPAANMNFEVIGIPTYKTAQDWFNIIQTAGIISGFELNNSRASAELDVGSGTGIIKTTDSSIGTSVSFDFAGVNNVTLTNNYVNYIYLDYNAGTPQIVATTDRTSIELNRQFTIGRVYRKDTTLHILNAGIELPNLARNDHERLVEQDGFQHASGAVTSKVGTLDLNITAGVWYLGHNRITTDAKNSDTGGDTWYYTHYGAASWIDDNLTASLVDTTHYNVGTDILGELTPNAYSVQWIYICSESCVLIIYGTSNGQLSAAEAEQPPTSVPNSIEGMGELIAKMIVRETGVIIDIQPVFDIVFSSNGVQNHNELGMIQGGAVDDYCHLTSAEETVATQEASTSVNGFLSSSKFDEIGANYLKVSNVTHTGEVTGSTALTVDKTAVTDQDVVTAVDADYVLIADTSDAGALKKSLISDFASVGSGVPRMIVAASNSRSSVGANYICDGTDDEVQILAAVAALPATGGEVLLLDGTFDIDSNSIIVTKLNVSIRGSGRSTILRTTTTDLIIAGNDSATVTGFSASNFATDVTGAFHSIKFFKNIQYSSVDNIYIDGGYHGIFLDSGGCDYNMIYDCTIRNVSAGGIEIDSPISKHIMISNCFVNGEMAEGMYICAAEHVSITGCNIGDGPNWGIQFLDGCKYCSAKGNNITAEIYGISLGAVSGTVSHCVVSENIITGCGQNGIDLDYADDCTISGNSILASSQTTDDTYFGIEMDHGNNNIIGGNTIRKGAETNKSAYGINITANATLTMLHGNDLFESGDTGAIADAGTNTRARDNIGIDGAWLAE